MDSTVLFNSTKPGDCFVLYCFRFSFQSVKENPLIQSIRENSSEVSSSFLWIGIVPQRTTYRTWRFITLLVPLMCHLQHQSKILVNNIIYSQCIRLAIGGCCDSEPIYLQFMVFLLKGLNERKVHVIIGLYFNCEIMKALIVIDHKQIITLNLNLLKAVCACKIEDLASSKKALNIISIFHYPYVSQFQLAGPLLQRLSCFLQLFQACFALAMRGMCLSMRRVHQSSRHAVVHQAPRVPTCRQMGHAVPQTHTYTFTPIQQTSQYSDKHSARSDDSTSF